MGDLRGRNLRVLWFLRLEKAAGYDLCFLSIRLVFSTPLFLQTRFHDTTTGGTPSLVFLSVPSCLLVPELLSSHCPTVFVLRLSSRKHLLVSGALIYLLDELATPPRDAKHQAVSHAVPSHIDIDWHPLVAKPKISPLDQETLLSKHGLLSLLGVNLVTLLMIGTGDSCAIILAAEGNRWRLYVVVSDIVFDVPAERDMMGSILSTSRHLTHRHLLLHHAGLPSPNIIKR